MFFKKKTFIEEIRRISKENESIRLEQERQDTEREQADTDEIVGRLRKLIKQAAQKGAYHAHYEAPQREHNGRLYHSNLLQAIKILESEGFVVFDRNHYFDDPKLDIYWRQ